MNKSSMVTLSPGRYLLFFRVWVLLSMESRHNLCRVEYVVGCVCHVAPVHWKPSNAERKSWQWNRLFFTISTMRELKWNIQAFELLKSLNPEPELQTSNSPAQRDLTVSNYTSVRYLVFGEWSCQWRDRVVEWKSLITDFRQMSYNDLIHAQYFGFSKVLVNGKQ